ncbi:hypothetical protein ACHAW5_010954 [Stephanodiscus triporus]|uniref:Uncharacterized protein n=1 Tax=Stephanodiscus triporus TaxID=2934178 RepID=A0ABD3QRL3_9STRA
MNDGDDYYDAPFLGDGVRGIRAHRGERGPTGYRTATRVDVKASWWAYTAPCAAVEEVGAGATMRCFTPARQLSWVEMTMHVSLQIPVEKTKNKEVKNDGVLFGPGKANSYVKSIESMSYDKCQNLIPSPGFVPNQQPLEGWELKDFWEETSWPRDNSGTGVRFGLPVPERKIWMNRSESSNCNFKSGAPVGSEGGMDKKEMQRQSTVIIKIHMSHKFDGVASFSLLCDPVGRARVLIQCLQRWRENTLGANCCSPRQMQPAPRARRWGNNLGLLPFVACLFHNGIRYGAVFTSKLPSDRLDKAIRDLEAGEDFDTSLEEEEND